MVLAQFLTLGPFWMREIYRAIPYMDDLGILGLPNVFWRNLSFLRGASLGRCREWVQVDGLLRFSLHGGRICFTRRTASDVSCFLG